MMNSMPSLESIHSVVGNWVDNNNSTFLEQWNFATNDSEKVYCMNEVLENLGLLRPPTPPPMKSSYRSYFYRVEGDEFLNKQKPQKALNLYNRAVMYAPMNSLELSLSYARRSAALFTLKKYDQCVEDIMRAITTWSLERSYVDLLMKRRMACHHFSSRRSPVNDVQRGNGRIFKRPTRTNPEIPCADYGIDIVNYLGFGLANGRRVIATRDIKAGTVLAYEEPNSVVLMKEFTMTRCNYCCKRNEAMIPCENCSFVLYCNDSCKLLAHRKYHVLECPIMHLLTSMGFDSSTLLAIRIVLQAKSNVRSWYQMSQLVEEAESRSFHPKRGFIQLDSLGHLYDSRTYTSVHMLEIKKRTKHFADMVKNATAAAVVVHLFKSLTHIFTETREDCETEFRTRPLTVNNNAYIAGGLFFHNAMISIQKLINLDALTENTQGLFIKGTTYAVGMYPLAYLINHSCNPNVCKVNIGTFQALISTKTIKEGSQLVMSHGCNACNLNWPLYQYLPVSRTGQRNPNLSYENIISTDFVDEIMRGNPENTFDSVDRLLEQIDRLESETPCKDMVAYQSVVKQIWRLHGTVITLDELYDEDTYPRA